MIAGQRSPFSGEDIAAREAAFFASLEHSDSFSVDTAVTPGSELDWDRGDIVRHLLTSNFLDSEVSLRVDTAEDVTSFAEPLDFVKDNADIHFPGSPYAFPRWARQFEGAARQIIDYEHATNPRADQQIAVIRAKQLVEAKSRKLAHVDLLLPNVRNFHLYLVANAAPTISFGGRFHYEPHPDARTAEDPLPFFEDLDRQFDPQVEAEDIVTQYVDPFEITIFAANTVHRREPTPPGRTLFGIEFWEVAEEPGNAAEE